MCDYAYEKSYKMEKKKQEKENSWLWRIHRYLTTLLRGTENETTQSSTPLQSPHQDSISVHPESEEGQYLNRAMSVLVTINSSITRFWLRHHQTNHVLQQDQEIAVYDNVNLPPPVPPPCVSGSSVLLDSSSNINGFTSFVEPRFELVNMAYGGAPVPAVLGTSYYPSLHLQVPQHCDIEPPLLSERGPITRFGTLMEKPATPLVK